jgi:hypothetical protein
MATPVEPTPDSHQHPTHVPLSNWRNPWVVLASVLVLVFIVFGLISHAAVHFGPQMYTRITGTSGPAGAGMWGPEGARRSVAVAPGGSQVQGVVTAIDGTKLTIAGDGTTSTVYTSSATQYIGASSAAVNDTVDVTGTTSDGTFTASSIAINQ